MSPSEGCATLSHMLPLTGSFIAIWGSPFLFNYNSNSIDINSNTGLHFHGDLLPRKYLHIYSVWFSKVVWKRPGPLGSIIPTSLGRNKGLNDSKSRILFRVLDSAYEVLLLCHELPFQEIKAIFAFSFKIMKDIYIYIFFFYVFIFFLKK